MNERSREVFEQYIPITIKKREGHIYSFSYSVITSLLKLVKLELKLVIHHLLIQIQLC